jgi:hypothetical protein
MKKPKPFNGNFRPGDADAQGYRPSQYQDLADWCNYKANKPPWKIVPLSATALGLTAFLVPSVYLPITLFCGLLVYPIVGMAISVNLKLHHSNMREIYRDKAKKYAKSKLPKLAAPNALTGQCPVCGLDDLPYWKTYDEERPWLYATELHVVSYGEKYRKKEAHRDCAAEVPYVEAPITACSRGHHSFTHLFDNAQTCKLCGVSALVSIPEDFKTEETLKLTNDFYSPSLWDFRTGK